MADDAPALETLIDLIARHDPVRDHLEPALRGLLGDFQDAFSCTGGAAVFCSRAEPDPRDVMRGWRPVWFCSTASPRVERLVRTLARGLRWLPKVDIVPNQYLTDQPNSHTVSRDRYPEGSTHRRFAERTGVHHRLLLEVPISSTAMVLVLLDRADDDPFSADELDVGRLTAKLLVPQATRWYAVLGLSDGVVLSPRERDVQRCLGLGMSEDEGADALGLRKSSFHQVVVKLYRKRGVASRGELLAKLLVPSDNPAAVSERRIDAGLDAGLDAE